MRPTAAILGQWVHYIIVLFCTSVYCILHFSTGQLSDKNVTPFSNSAFRGNFAKTKARNLQKVSNRRHQNFDSELYGFERVMKMIQCKKSLLMGLIFYGNFWEFLAFTGSQL